jgi:Transposase DDE domain group 1
MEQYTRFSEHASLALIAEWTKLNHIWEDLADKVHIHQKTIKHSPSDKLKDVLINIWAGGQRICSINNLLRTDEGLQRIFGRASCAEQSTISETLNAVSVENIGELEGWMKQVYRDHSLCYQHDYEKNWLLLDVDLTGMIAGKTAEGSEKGYFSGERNGRGRQVGRVYASQYDEIVNEQLYPGKVQLEASLLELVELAEHVLDSEENCRKRTIMRVDGGGGTDKNIDQLLLDFYWLLIKVKNWQRTQKLVKTVKVWHSLPELPGHEVGWVERPHEYAKATRQLAIRWPKEKGGFHYCVLVFNLTDLMIFQLAGLLLPRHLTDQELFSAIMKAYNLRSGGVETSIRNSKQGLGLNKRNKKRFHAQHLLLLLAQLAYNIAVWARNQLKEYSTLIASFGMLRLIRDAFHISGQVQVDEQGKVNLIILNQSHKLARAFQQTWQACFPRNDLSLILGKI